MRVWHHPVLGDETRKPDATIIVDGREVPAIEGEPIAAALLAAGIKKFRETPKYHKPRGIFCAIGRCTDCVMTVDGVPNVRTCVTPVRDGMVISTQKGLGKWGKEK
ncbi:(2Fe-2S)-binding protein [Thermoanaerobacterium sp. DL9XJH110]|uniref:(2Fe-2S)-binding protein n=1 Tax=Thermoanaerobacterium sp. DL9XJH110 TaxID=3386643 RepID=UPI003BB4999F